MTIKSLCISGQLNPLTSYCEEEFGSSPYPSTFFSRSSYTEYIKKHFLFLLDISHSCTTNPCQSTIKACRNYSFLSLALKMGFREPDPNNN
jgi:hypothetical protein